MTTNLSSRRRTGILATMSLALVAVVASVSGLNVALNDLAVELDASTGAVLWIVNAYTLALAALLLPIGEMGDRFGRRRILLIGLGIFAVANGLAAMAGSATEMIVYRSVAGLGAAMIMPATLSIITAVFPAEERGRAVGVWAGFAGAGGVLGLFFSAIIIDAATWPWLFALPIGAAVAAAVATMAIVPESRNEEPAGFDLVGALLSIVAVGGIVLGVHEGPEQGWTAIITLASLVAGGLASVAFVAWELAKGRAHDIGARIEPLLDVRIFGNRSLAAGSLSLTLVFALVFGSFLVVIQYLQAVLGYSAVVAAAGLLPMAAMMMGLSPVAPRIADRLGLGNVLGGGALILAAGFAFMGVATSDPSYVAILPGLLLVGTGVGITMSPATTAITGSLPRSKQGLASALNDTVREFGAALGVALIGSALSAGYRSSISDTAEQLPAELAEPAEEGIGQALAVAEELGPQGQDLAAAAQNAFLDGWGVAMTVATVAAVATGVLAWGVYRRRPADVPVDETGEPALTAA